MLEFIDMFRMGVITDTLDIDNESLISFTKEYSTANPKSQIISNRGGYQSDDLLKNNNEAWQALLKIIQVRINEAAEFYSIKKKLKLTNNWFNLNNYKDYNNKHNHPHSIISGVYYIQTFKDCGNIVFHSPADSEMPLYFEDNFMSKNTEFNSSRYYMPAIAGRLYLFPGFMGHTVEPNMNKDKQRISMSFNSRYDI